MTQTNTKNTWIGTRMGIVLNVMRHGTLIPTHGIVLLVIQN